jgi:diketogulonate reductase-like aldo/keto reductase
MRQWNLPGSDIVVPVIGQGTWGLGESPRTWAKEAGALSLGLDLGLTLIDTAEYYSAGGAERLVGQVVRDRRDQVFLVSKVWPRYRTGQEVVQAVEGSLRRLDTPYLDAVLWHWPSRSIPLDELTAAFRALERRGLVRTWGISNFWGAWFERAVQEADRQETRIWWNQVPYALDRRAAEPFLMDRARTRDVTLMAYSPLGRGGRLFRHRGRAVLKELAAKRGVSQAQLALAWTVREPGVIALAKAFQPEHIRANAASDFPLTPDETAALDQVFPAARRPPWGLPPTRPLFELAYWVEQRRIARFSAERP